MPFVNKSALANKGHLFPAGVSFANSIIYAFWTHGNIVRVSESNFCAYVSANTRHGECLGFLLDESFGIYLLPYSF